MEINLYGVLQSIIVKIQAILKIFHIRQSPNERNVLF
jgi:hypothetical protein